MKSLKILSTKKLSDEIRSTIDPGWELTEADFIHIVNRNPGIIKEELSSWKPMKQPLNIVFTSKHAVVDPMVLLNCEVAGFRVFCLSGATMNKVKEILPEVIIAAKADHASALAEKLIGAGIEEVLFFCGNKRRQELPDLLAQAGIVVKEVVVYETEPEPLKTSKDFDAILFFSPTAVESFFTENGISAATVCLAIGETTAEAIRDHAINHIIIAKEPSQQCMLEALRDFAGKINWNEDDKK